MARTGTTLKALFGCACAAALCVALAGCGGSAASSSAASAQASSSEAQASSASAAASSASASATASSASAASSASSTNVAEEALDEHKNITLYAIMEMTGPELAALLEAQEYEWDSAKSVWLRMVDGASFAALDGATPFTEADYAKATEKGGTAKGVASNVVGGYKDAEAALKGNAKCVVEDSFSDGQNVIAIVYGPSMEEHLVIAQPHSESTTEIDIYSKDAVASGMLNTIYNGEIGTTFQEVWKTFTGEDSYGH